MSVEGDLAMAEANSSRETDMDRVVFVIRHVDQTDYASDLYTDLVGFVSAGARCFVIKDDLDCRGLGSIQAQLVQTGDALSTICHAMESSPTDLYIFSRSIDNFEPDFVDRIWSVIGSGVDFVISDFDYELQPGARSSRETLCSWNMDYALALDFAGPFFALSRRAFESLANEFLCFNDLAHATSTGLRLEALGQEFTSHRLVGANYHNGERRITSDPRAEFYSYDASLSAAMALASQLGDNIGIRQSIDSKKRWVDYHHASPEPSVAIVIPTRDHLELLGSVVHSILNKTKYLNYRLVIIDNDSAEHRVLEYLEHLRGLGVEIVRYPGIFNYAAMHNAVVPKLNCDFVCFINNDVLIQDPYWLSDFIALGTRRDVGVVGAKLLYADRSVQHAGVLIGGNGESSHYFKGIEVDDPGYRDRAKVTVELMAVTGAALLTRHGLFCELGGFDAENFAISFNDIDYCLRVRQVGYRVLFNPAVQLFHFESKSRKLDSANEQSAARHHRELASMRKKWGTTFEFDPYFNPDLDPWDPTFSTLRGDFEAVVRSE